MGCHALTTVTIGGSVESIGSNVFSYCDALTTVTIEGSVESIGAAAFEACALTAVALKGPLQSIGSDAFRNCKALTSVDIEGSVGAIGYGAFWNCDALTTVTIKGSVESIGERAFYKSDTLATVTIQGSVGSIGEMAFDSCGALTTVTIDGPVESIGIEAFSSCDHLDTVTITGPITAIGGNAFFGSENLETLNIACNDPLNITAGSADNGRIAQHAVTVNHVHRYSATYTWADDGSSCTVHMVCANSSDHKHDEIPPVTSVVKIPPTATEVGTTEYSVSGTYDGFAYSDTKDVQDIPATGGDPYSPGGKTSSYNRFTALALTLSVLFCLGMVGAVVLLRRRTV